MQVEVSAGQSVASFTVKSDRADEFVTDMIKAHLGAERASEADAMTNQQKIDTYLNLLKQVSKQWVLGWRQEQAARDAAEAVPDTEGDIEP